MVRVMWAWSAKPRSVARLARLGSPCLAGRCDQGPVGGFRSLGRFADGCCDEAEQFFRQCVVDVAAGGGCEQASVGEVDTRVHVDALTAREPFPEPGREGEGSAGVAACGTEDLDEGGAPPMRARRCRS